jgi:4-aminobutyrate aminotransferase
VRGRALWIGLSFGDHDRATAVEQACFHRGLLALGCGDDAIRISPPLVFREDQVRSALEVFEEAVVEVEAAGS